MKPLIIYLAKKGIKPIIKSQAIMRHDEKTNTDYVIAYLKKGKMASDKEYWTVLDYLFRASE
jgi:hypothetical protein